MKKMGINIMSQLQKRYWIKLELLSIGDFSCGQIPEKNLLHGGHGRPVAGDAQLVSIHLQLSKQQLKPAEKHQVWERSANSSLNTQDSQELLKLLRVERKKSSDCIHIHSFLLVQQKCKRIILMSFKACMMCHKSR